MACCQHLCDKVAVSTPCYGAGFGVGRAWALMDVRRERRTAVDDNERYILNERRQCKVGEDKVLFGKMVDCVER